MSSKYCEADLYLPKVQSKWRAKVEPQDSFPYKKECQINANNDLLLVNQWLSEYQNKKNTYLTYRREAFRFLMWSIYNKGETLNNLNKEDLKAYFKFLQFPPRHWLIKKGEKIKKKRFFY